MYADSRGVERNRLDNKLSALHHKRSLIIYDIARKAHIVTLSIKQSKDQQLELVFEFVEEPAGLFRTEIPVKTDGVFIESKSEVVVICMDFVGSTEMLSEMGVSATIDTNLRFYRDIIGLIRNKYYPFVYLHEVIGDSFIVVINADWAYTSQLFCATLSVKFVQDLVMATRHYITIRTGIAYGKIRYGTIGATFRMFGFPMNMSSRLETVCNPNEMNICNKVNTKLLVEHAHLQIPTDVSLKRTASLKGFGTTDYYTIPITEGTARE
jgi:class 3 adenylate cyclase